MYNISHWCGRFGNNAQQLLNALYVFDVNGWSFFSPDNTIIYPIRIDRGHYQPFCNPFFFHVPSQTGQGRAHFDSNVAELKTTRRKYGAEIFKNLKVKPFNPLDEDMVVIHIRSGDIFSRPNYYHPVISCYVQNPLKYYLDIIKRYSKVMVISEDYENPISRELYERLKGQTNIIFLSLSFEETIKLLLASKNIAGSGVSSFVPACAAISPNIKRLHCSDIKMDEILNYTDLQGQDIEVEVTHIDQNRYIKCGQWKNTTEQWELMLNYE